MSLFTNNEKNTECFRLVHQASCFASADVPGMKVVKSFGILTVEISENAIGGYNGKDRSDITHIIINEAMKLGANAVINFRMLAGSFAVGKAGFIVAYGDAVTLEPTE